MIGVILVVIGIAATGCAAIQSPFHRYCAALNELGSCHHFRGPLVTTGVPAAHLRRLGALWPLLHPFAGPYDHIHPDDLEEEHLTGRQRAEQLDNRHFLDMFLHENGPDGAVSPLDIPLDRSYTHHPNRWEWN